MTLRQMAVLKRWHVLHRDRAPIEYLAWDATLTLWLIGCMGVPPGLLLHWTWGMAACIALSFAPQAYVWLRTRLHRRGALRCDWLPVLRAH
jgi:hypothetical protein